MEIANVIEYILNQLLSNFDFGYMFTINVLVYIIVKIIDDHNGNKKVSTWQKRVVLLVSIIVMYILYKIDGYTNNIILINSSILAPVFWSWILKPICDKMGIGYKRISKHLN